MSRILFPNNRNLNDITTSFVIDLPRPRAVCAVRPLSRFAISNTPAAQKLLIWFGSCRLREQSAVAAAQPDPALAATRRALQPRDLLAQGDQRAVV
ncbi:MAG: hypothetical protein Kow00124_31070 [Anaerolineae bacterium]